MIVNDKTSCHIDIHLVVVDVMSCWYSFSNFNIFVYIFNAFDYMDSCFKTLISLIKSSIKKKIKISFEN